MGGSYVAEGTWSWVSIALWIVWGVMFGILEFQGLRRSGDGWPPLTYVFKRYIPALAGLALCSWLLFHAVQTYLGWFT